MADSLLEEQQATFSIKTLHFASAGTLLGEIYMREWVRRGRRRRRRWQVLWAGWQPGRWLWRLKHVAEHLLHQALLLLASLLMSASTATSE